MSQDIEIRNVKVDIGAPIFEVEDLDFRKNQGRTVSYPAAPSQIPACGTTAPGSSNLLTYALTIRYSPQ
jgi:hypothetical protein